MPTIYLSGCETPALLADVIEFGGTHVALSYYELQRGKGTAKVIALLEKHRGTVQVLLNAGARAAVAHGQASADYFRSYRRFLREYGHLFQMATEFDADGFDPAFDALDMAEWQDELAAVGTVPIVPVWHASRGAGAWTALCADPRFPRLGLGAGTALEQPSLVARLIGQARNSGKLVHGFGQTKILTTLKTLPFSSIDSRSWKSGERFGTLFVFHHHQWKQLTALSGDGGASRAKYRDYFTAIGCVWKRLQADDPRELRKANVIAWTNLSKRLQMLDPLPKPAAPPVQTRPRLIAKRKSDVEPVGAMRRDPAGDEQQPVPLPVSAESGIARHEPASAPAPDERPAQSGSPSGATAAAPASELVRPAPTPITIELTAKTGGRPTERLIKGMMPDESFLHCSTCSIGALCPKYSEGSTCAFTSIFREMPTRDINDVATSLAMLVEENASRYRFARMFEQQLGGGMPSKETTELSKVLADQLTALGKVMKSTKAAKVTGDSEGILSKIFGGSFSDPPQLGGAAPAPDDAASDALSHGADRSTSDPDVRPSVIDTHAVPDADDGEPVDVPA